MKERGFRVKNTKVLFFIGLLCAFVMGATQVHGSWTSGGPYGGWISCLAMAPNPNVIYAGTSRGLFKTVDAGATWTESFSPILVRTIQASPKKSECHAESATVVVHVGTEDGIYKSEDGGETWFPKRLVGKEIYAIAVDPKNSCILFAGTSDGKIFKSSDGGENWEEKLSGQMDWVEALLIDVDNSDYIYAGGHDHFWKSTDGGETWVERQVGSQWSDVVYSLAMTPAGHSPKVIYAVRYLGMLHKSTDLGDTWEPLYETGDISAPVAVDPNSPNIIYAGTGHKSIDAGATWSLKQTGLPKGITDLQGAINPPGAMASGIAIDPTNSAIYLGLYNGAVFKSTDYAENWNFSSHGMTAGIYIYDLAIHPDLSSTVFAAVWGEAHTLAKTTNGGATWEYLPNSATNLRAVAIYPQDPKIIWTGDGYRRDYSFFVYKSIDGGQTWTPKKFFQFVGPLGGDYTAVKDIIVKPDDPDSIFVGADLYVKPDGSINEGGVLARSTDGGNTWWELGFSSSALAADPTDPAIIYWGKRRANQVYRITDAWGDSINITEITPAEGIGEVRDIEVDSGSTVYFAAKDGLWRWDGSNWVTLTGLPTDDIRALAIDRSTSPGTVYVGTGSYGIFVSSDGGSTWTSFNENLGNMYIRKLAISSNQPKMIYAGTYSGGVWSRRLSSVAMPWMPLLLLED